MPNRFQRYNPEWLQQTAPHPTCLSLSLGGGRQGDSACGPGGGARVGTYCTYIFTVWWNFALIRRFANFHGSIIHVDCRESISFEFVTIYYMKIHKFNVFFKCILHIEDLPKGNSESHYYSYILLTVFNLKNTTNRISKGTL